MKSLQAVRHEQALGTQASATTARSAAIDCSDADYVAITVDVTAEVNTNSTNVILDVLQADIDAATNYASLGTTLIDNTASIRAIYNVNMVGKKKFLKVTVTPDTTTNGAVSVGAIGVMKVVGLTPPASAPTSSQTTTVG